MLNEKVKVASLPKYGLDYCRTLVATDVIEQGEAVWWYEAGNGEEEAFYTWADIEHEKDEAKREALKNYSYMVGVDTYASTTCPEEDPSWFFNHSCDGNCCYASNKKVVASRCILPGEELAYDYALTETEASFHAGMVCKCGAESCRGVLKFDDYKSPAFWQQYAGKTTSHIAARGQECGWLDSRLHVRRISISYHSEEQRGVFALKSVPKGTLLAVFGGKTVGHAEASLLEKSDPKSGPYPYLLQVESNLWQVPHRINTPDAPDYINHSCTANSGLIDSTQVVSLRDIAAGEEVTVDYAMINDGTSTWAGDNFKCGCGSLQCRGQVTSTDWQLRHVQDRYWPHFSPFVKRKIAAIRPDLAAVESMQRLTVAGTPKAAGLGTPRASMVDGTGSAKSTPSSAICISVKAG